MVQFK